MKNFGNNLGIAYQLMDDTLDYISTEEELGKTIGKDLTEGKITLPLIHTLQESSRKDREFIITTLKNEKLTKKSLDTLLSVIKKYQGLEYTAKKAKTYALKAKKELNGLSPSPAKEALIAIADYVLERRH